MHGLLVHPSAQVRDPELGVLCGAQEKAKVAWGALCLAPHPNPSSLGELYTPIPGCNVHCSEAPGGVLWLRPSSPASPVPPEPVRSQMKSLSGQLNTNEPRDTGPN